MPPRRSSRKPKPKDTVDEAAAPATSLADEGDAGQVTTQSSSSQATSGRASSTQTKQKSADTSDPAGPPLKKRKAGGAQPVVDDQVDDKKKGIFSLELLLKLPFDVVAEISTHLDGGDLLMLSRTCKTLRECLASRLRRELPLPDDMTEQQLMDLIYNKNCAVDLRQRVSYSPSLFLRFCLCWTCEKKTLIQGSKIRNGLKGPHPQARQCMRFAPDMFSPDNKAKFKFVIRDLWAESAKLYELAEQDELAKHALKKATKSKRGKGMVQNAPATDSLARCVAGREAWVRKEQAVSQQLWDTIQAERRAVRQMVEDEEKRRADEKQANIDDLHRTLRNQHDWTQPQLDWHSAHPAHYRVPRTSPNDDSAAWASFRDWVQGEVARVAAETAARVAREARQDSLKPYYASFKRAQSLRMQRVVPDFVEFVQRPAVKPLWEPADAAPMSTSAWSAVLPAIRDDFIAYQEELRVEAIRAIICATTGDWQQATSRDSADYPRHKYDEDWFERPTALFWGDRADNRAIALALPYPETLWGHFAEGDRKEWLRKHIDNHTSRLVRLVLEAAGMDEDTARQEDFVGVKFRWVDNPYKQKKAHERLYNWVELVYALKRRGPKAYELVSGTKVPQLEVSIEGKGEREDCEDWE
ncbi:hypothetical protein DMC30DRAFT_414737 [Rhodotorula diobovata]|uniref:F-box domain-containing protein n=1 Tax=Rhodotorula diobovata TaxID=5288 RepID=A0A5C5G354_9BASI|nr:hypothetical protein DMC30DRAFT_414737 [Rhodotorula diobovata]